MVLGTSPSVSPIDEGKLILSFTRTNRRENIAHFWDELRELWAAKNLTIVFVTHSVYESVYLSSRIITFSPRPGRVIADSTMAEPKTRDRDFRMTPLYGERCREIRDALQREAVS